jgi:hypothetical protein
MIAVRLSQFIEVQIRDKTVLIDAEDAYLLEGKNWSFANGVTRYLTSCRENGKITRKSKYLHLLIINANRMNREGCQVIFKNGNKLDCRKDNLKVVSRHLVQAMKPQQRNNTSGYKGVSEVKPGKWQATMCIYGKQTNLGTFDNPVDAAKVYNQKILELFGDGVWVNPV